MSITNDIIGSLLVATSAWNAGLQFVQLRRRAGKRCAPVSLWRILVFETAGSMFRIAVALLVYGIYVLLGHGLWVLLGIEAAILAWNFALWLKSRIRRSREAHSG